MKTSSISEQFASALSYDRYLQTGTDEQQRRWTQVYDIAHLTNAQQQLVGGLYTTVPDQGLNKPGKLWLDFNRLENPPCAYTAYATCPLPPPQNRLTVAIPAGEQRYHE